MNNTPDLQQRLRHVAWTKPSTELRARVLAEAQVTRASIAWTDRVWFSRGWRQFLVAAGVALITMAGWPLREAPDPSEKTAASATIAFVEEVALEAGFEPEQAAALARHTARESHTRAASYGLTVAQSLLQGGDR